MKFNSQYPLSKEQEAEVNFMFDIWYLNCKRKIANWNDKSQNFGSAKEQFKELISLSMKGESQESSQK